MSDWSEAFAEGDPAQYGYLDGQRHEDAILDVWYDPDVEERDFESYVAGFYEGWEDSFVKACPTCQMPLVEHVPESYDEDGNCIVGQYRGRYAS